MMNWIRGHVLDLLGADSRLLLGGNAYAPRGLGNKAWSSVQRIEKGGMPAAGAVNLYDTSYEKDSSDHRPAIFCGSRAFGASSRRDLQAISGVYIEYRIMILPLMVVSHQPDKLTAQAEADQLTANILLILVGSHQVETGYWYELTAPGDAGGGNAREQTHVTATPNDGFAMAISAVPLVIRYSWNPNSPA
jgi:hypothetical protein